MVPIMVIQTFVAAGTLGAPHPKCGIVMTPVAIGESRTGVRRSQGWYLRGYPPPCNVRIIISGAIKIIRVVEWAACLPTRIYPTRVGRVGIKLTVIRLV